MHPPIVTSTAPQERSHSSKQVLETPASVPVPPTHSIQQMPPSAATTTGTRSSTTVPPVYLASQPKVNQWYSGAVVAGPTVHDDTPADPNIIQPLGGLRNLAGTMSRLTYEVALGSRINTAFGKLFDENPSMVEDILSHVGRQDCTALKPELTAAAASCLRGVLQDALPSFKFSPGSESVPVNVELLDWWRTAAKDPDTEPVEWLKHGAPAGILIPVVDKGVFPTYDPTIDIVEVDPEDLHTEPNFSNYAGVDGDPDINKEVARILENKYAVTYDSVEHAEAALGGKVVLSNIGAIKTGGTLCS